MDLDNKLQKIHTEDSPFKIMINYLNGSHKIKKNIIIKNNLLLNKNFYNKRKDLWLLMLEYPKKSCKPKLEKR